MSNRSDPMPEARSETAPSAQRIVVGVDGSVASASALELGIRLCHALELSLTAIATWQEDDMVLDFPTGDPDHHAAAGRTLNRVAGQAFQGPWPAWFNAELREGDTAQILIEESATAQFLIIGHSSHRALTRLLYGSVSAFCVTHAHCPVIVAS